MLLGGFRVVVGAAMLALVSCATYVNTQLGRSLIDKNYWLYIIDSDAVNFYYAPYQTTFDADENVTSLVYGTRKANGTILYPSQVNVNCSGKAIRWNALDTNGNWKVLRDWNVPDPNSVDDWMIQRLCPIRAEDGGIRQFINVAPDARMPNKYTVFWWEYEKDFADGKSVSKTYRVYQMTTPENKLTYHYVSLRCESRTYVATITPFVKDQKWVAEPPPNSAYGFLMSKACGINYNYQNQNASKASSGTSGANSRVDIDEAKSKCVELGYKRGTEQYGNCVLKLSK